MFRRKKCVFIGSKQYPSHYHEKKKKPSGNITLLGSKNHINGKWKFIFQRMDAWPQFRLHLVYTYKLKYNIPTFKCIRLNRKPYSPVVHIFICDTNAVFSSVQWRPLLCDVTLLFPEGPLLRSLQMWSIGMILFPSKWVSCKLISTVTPLIPLQCYNLLYLCMKGREWNGTFLSDGAKAISETSDDGAKRSFNFIGSEYSFLFLILELNCRVSIGGGGKQNPLHYAQ